MDMDPVVLLAERLRMAERCARHIYAEQSGEAGNQRTAILNLLQKKLEATEPTSVLGAGELVMLAAGRLSSVLFTDGDQLRSIADRFHHGQRMLADLIWLRRLAERLEPGPDPDSNQVAALIRLALKGAARPVMIFRAVAPLPSDDETDDAETEIRFGKRLANRLNPEEHDPAEQAELALEE